jgi:DNA-binding LytR/AlgR family response regulator
VSGGTPMLICVLNKAISLMKTQTNTYESNSIFIKSDSFLTKIRFEDIDWVEALGNYVIIYTSEGKHTVHTTMKSIENKLPTDQFLRIHRSFIVNLFKINSVNGRSLKIEDNYIPISRSCKKGLMDKLYCL